MKEGKTLLLAPGVDVITVDVDLIRDKLLFVGAIGVVELVDDPPVTLVSNL